MVCVVFVMGGFFVVFGVLGVGLVASAWAMLVLIIRVISS